MRGSTVRITYVRMSSPTYVYARAQEIIIIVGGMHDSILKVVKLQKQ